MVLIKIIGEFIEDIYKCISNFTNDNIVLNIIIFAIIWVGVLSSCMMVMLIIIYIIIIFTRIVKKCYYRCVNKRMLIELGDNNNCAICLETLSGSCYKTLCGHIYHVSCLNRMIDKSIDESVKKSLIRCPMCRSKNMMFMLF